MFSALKKILGATKSTEVSLFSGSAYFSSRVPKAFTEEWVAHGGEISSSGSTLDARARYFFATDPSEPWVTKLFAKSVIVIHAGWIAHCVDEAFQVPITEYILDDRFVPGAPYKLSNIAPPMHVPLSESDGPTDFESRESGLTHVQISDTPSTPICMRRKRKREQAYFDSPSGSLVFSGFDKDGMPRRPRKQRKLRFDPSFSPGGRRSSRETKQGTDPDWLWDHHNTSKDDNEDSEERSQDTRSDTLRGLSHMTAVRSPNTPDKSLTCEEQSATNQQLSSDEHLPNEIRVSSLAIPIELQKKIQPIRTIDFTNLPPPTRRWRFPQSDATNPGDTGMLLSAVKPPEYKVKTPKKISFANHAQVCVYTVSPRRPDVEDDANAGPARQYFNEGFEDGPKANGKTRMSSDDVLGSDDSTAKANKEDLVSQTDTPKLNEIPTRLLGGDQFENETLTLTMEEVQAIRHRLLKSAAKNENGVDNGQLATLFELGKTFRGMAFRHVW